MMCGTTLEILHWAAVQNIDPNNEYRKGIFIRQSILITHLQYHQSLVPGVIPGPGFLSFSEFHRNNRFQTANSAHHFSNSLGIYVLQLFSLSLSNKPVALPYQTKPFSSQRLCRPPGYCVLNRDCQSKQQN